MESGSAASPPTFSATQRPGRTALWDSFISGIPQCAQFSGKDGAISCLQHLEHSPELDAAMEGAVTAAVEGAAEASAFTPVIDGEGGGLPDFPSRLVAKGHFARIPFIAGTNLDEGKVAESGLGMFRAPSNTT